MRRAGLFVLCGEFAELLLGQSAPAGGVAAAVAGGSAVGFDGAGIGVAGGSGLAEAFEGLAVVVEAFGIVGAAAGIDFQFGAGVGKLAGADVDAAKFAQHFAGTVTLVLMDHGLEVGERVAQRSE